MLMSHDGPTIDDTTNHEGDLKLATRGDLNWPPTGTLHGTDSLTHVGVSRTE